MFEEVKVVPWQNDEDLWGVTYLDTATGFRHGQMVGSRKEAEQEAEELKRAGRPGSKRQNIQERV